MFLPLTNPEQPQFAEHPSPEQWDFISGMCLTLSTLLENFPEGQG